MAAQNVEVDHSKLKVDLVFQILYQGLLTETQLEGEARGLQKSILSILNVRFPILAAASQTQQAIASIQDIAKLEMLQQALLLVSDEQVARVLLKLPTQGDLL